MATKIQERTRGEVALINNITAVGNDVGDLVAAMEGADTGFDQRWVAIAKTQLQQGFMALTRAVAKPESF